MSNKNNLKIRITILYIVYFIALIGGVIYNTAPAFKRGARLGGKVNAMIFESLGDEALRLSKVYIGVPMTDNQNIETFELGDEKNTSVTMTTSKFDIIVSQDADENMSLTDIVFNSVGGSALIYLGSLAIMAMYLIVFILIFLIIHSLHKSIKNDLPLDKQCVWYTRTIGLIIIVIDILDAWGEWAMSQGAAKILEGSEFTVDTAFTLNYYTLLLAILVIFTAEIFSIGSKLGEEQKLTI